MASSFVSDQFCDHLTSALSSCISRITVAQRVSSLLHHSCPDGHVTLGLRRLPVSVCAAARAHRYNQLHHTYKPSSSHKLRAHRASISKMLGDSSGSSARVMRSPRTRRSSGSCAPFSMKTNAVHGDSLRTRLCQGAPSKLRKHRMGVRETFLFTGYVRDQPAARIKTARLRLPSNV